MVMEFPTMKTDVIIPIATSWIPGAVPRIRTETE
jgi:hypothetical protein